MNHPDVLCFDNSLGGNTKTVMCANAGPAEYNYDETVSTLRCGISADERPVERWMFLFLCRPGSSPPALALMGRFHWLAVGENRYSKVSNGCVLGVKCPLVRRVLPLPMKPYKAEWPHVQRDVTSNLGSSEKHHVLAV